MFILAKSVARVKWQLMKEESEKRCDMSYNQTHDRSNFNTSPDDENENGIDLYFSILQ